MSEDGDMSPSAKRQKMSEDEGDDVNEGGDVNLEKGVEEPVSDDKDVMEVDESVEEDVVDDEKDSKSGEEQKDDAEEEEEEEEEPEPGELLIRSETQTSGYAGVYWLEGPKKWLSQIQVQKGKAKECVTLGMCSSKLEAARAYMKAYQKEFGDEVATAVAKASEPEPEVEPEPNHEPEKKSHKKKEAAVVETIDEGTKGDRFAQVSQLTANFNRRLMRDRTLRLETAPVVVEAPPAATDYAAMDEGFDGDDFGGTYGAPPRSAARVSDRPQRSRRSSDYADIDDSVFEARMDDDVFQPQRTRRYTPVPEPVEFAPFPWENFALDETQKAEGWVTEGHDLLNKMTYRKFPSHGWVGGKLVAVLHPTPDDPETYFFNCMEDGDNEELGTSDAQAALSKPDWLWVAKANDTPRNIARRAGFSGSEVSSLNRPRYPGLKSDTRLYPGQLIVVPSEEALAALQAESAATAAAAPPAATIQEWGDDQSLYYALDDETPKQIAVKLGIDPNTLIKINKERYSGLTLHAKLEQGTAILVPSGKVEELAASPTMKEPVKEEPVAPVLSEGRPKRTKVQPVFREESDEEIDQEEAVVPQRSSSRRGKSEAPSFSAMEAEPEIEEAMIGCTVYQALNNENLKQIGAKLGCDPGLLLETNAHRFPGLTLGGKLRAGTCVQVPLSDEGGGAEDLEFKVYVAIENETPKSIAAKLQVTAKELVEFNKEKFPGLLQTSKLVGGTQLYIPGTEKVVEEVTEKKIGSPQKPLVTIGNTHTILTTVKAGEPAEEWTVFLRHANGTSLPSTAIGIKEVVFTLHPDFDPSVVTVKSAPFEVTRVGWGAFDVGVEVRFKDGHGPSQKFSHLLVFDQKPSFSVVPLK